MSTHDEQFMQALLAAFKDEAGEHIQALSASLLELEKPTPGESPSALIERLYREAHSLKGAARAVNRLDVEAVCQAVETVLAGWKKGAPRPPPEGFDQLHHTFDQLRNWVAVTSPAPAALVTSRVQAVAALLEPATVSPAATSPPGVPATPCREGALTAKSVECPAFGADEASALTTPAVPVDHTGNAETVRIGIAKLDALLLGLEEMLAVKLAARRHTSELQTLVTEFERWRQGWARLQTELWRQRTRDLETRLQAEDGAAAATGTPGALPPAVAEFLDWNHGYVTSLAASLNRAARAAQQDEHTVGKLVDDLLDDSKRLLMLPFNTVLGQLPKQVRDLCREQGKDARVVITGGEIELDKRVLEQLKDPLVHLIRNCVDHGIELPERRTVAHKPSCGTLALAVSALDGGKVELLVGDDGAGIDLEQVKAAALALGLVTAAEVATLSAAEALALVFRSGVSTRSCVSELSGRGLGLAIVREKIEKLGGHVTVKTRPGSGTVFCLTVPLTLATLRGLLIAVAGQPLVIPTTAVERVTRVRPTDIQTTANRESVVLDGRTLSLVRLAQVLELAPSAAPEKMAGDTFVTVVVLGSGDRRVAFAVDAVLAEEEVLVKPFAKPLVRVRNITGATVLATGRAVPVLNVADLLKSAVAMGTPAASVATTAATAKPGPKRVLLVEDSITARMLLKDILEGAGYQVQTAVDGLDAWTRLRTTGFDAVVSDVEMPRLNGLELTARIRADAGLATLPVILVTALASPQDRERGVDVGANAYVVKSSFDQNNLLELLARMV